MSLNIEIDKKALKIAERFGYTPIKGLDKDRPYVLLAKKDNKYYVIKTSHLEDEAEILKILNSNGFFKNQGIVIPKLYQHGQHGKTYIVEDYIKGREIDIKDDNFEHSLGIVIEKLSAVEGGFNRSPRISEFTKGWDDQYSKKGFKNSVWLKKRITRWFSDEMSSRKNRFMDIEANEVYDLLDKIQGKNIITFGAFSPAHIRINKERIGIFDFGKHLRWAPKYYDRAYLWWGLLYDRDLNEPSPKYWRKLAVRIQSNIPNNEKAYYWSCILERLAGLAKDLTQSDRAKNPKWKKVITKIKNKMTIFAIGKLKKVIIE